MTSDPSCMLLAKYLISNGPAFARDVAAWNLKISLLLGWQYAQNNKFHLLIHSIILKRK